MQRGGALFPYEWRVSTVYTLEKARRDLCYQPRYDMRSGLERTYRWYLESGLAEQEWDFSQNETLLRRLGYTIPSAERGA